MSDQQLQELIDSIHPRLHRINMDSLLLFLGNHPTDDLKSRILPDDIQDEESGNMMSCYWQGKQQLNFTKDPKNKMAKWNVIEINASTAPFIRTNVMNGLEIIEKDPRLKCHCRSFVDSNKIQATSIGDFQILYNNKAKDSSDGDVICSNAVYGKERKDYSAHRRPYH